MRSPLLTTSSHGRLGKRSLSALRTLSCASTVLFSPLRPVGSMTKSTAVGRCARLANVSRSISLRSSAGRSSRPLAGSGEHEAREGV